MTTKFKSGYSDILHGARRLKAITTTVKYQFIKYNYNRIDNIKHQIACACAICETRFVFLSSRIKVMFKLICHMRCISVFTKVLNLSSQNNGKGHNQGHSNREFSGLTPTFEAENKIHMNHNNALDVK